MATFVDNRLEKGWYSKNTERNARGPIAWRQMVSVLLADMEKRGLFPVHAFITEYPQVYDKIHQLGDQDDIIQLACVAGAVSGAIPAKHYMGVLPREWKGQVPKKIHNLRMLNRITEQERANIEPAIEQMKHNIYDAVGIGLFFLEKEGVRIKQRVLTND